MRGSPPWPKIDVEKAAPWIEKRTGKCLAPSQRAAIEMTLRSKVAVITGGPCVGNADHAGGQTNIAYPCLSVPWSGNRHRTGGWIVHIYGGQERVGQSTDWAGAFYQNLATSAILCDERAGLCRTKF